MPRNKSLLQQQQQQGARKSNKIVIRPYRKPPSLPPNYYAETVDGLLQGTLDCLTKSTSSNKAVSLQAAYTAVVTLVRHQYGPQLYQDVMRQFQQAAEYILPASSSPKLLASIPQQYSQFLEYLFVCKHVFMALDRTHVWNVTEQRAVPSTTTSTTGQQSLWTAGLAQFRARMMTLNLEHALYQEWLETLLQDWRSAAGGSVEQHDHLQAVWYMWQDLGLLTSTSPLPLQHDLETYWKRAGQELWQTSLETPLPAAKFLQACHQFHSHVVQAWPWLPVPWLWHVLDTQLVTPHLAVVLQDEYLGKLLQQELVSVKTSTDTSTPIQQLWMLAGRLPDGQKQVATAICVFAKQQGLKRLSEEPAQTVAVSNLIQLQQNLQRLIATLPAGSDLISFKSVWEEVVNDPSWLAEALAKFLDSILRSNKKLDLYATQNDAWLNRIIAGVFCPLQSKDVFEAFYKRDLAKRLLWNRVVSMDVEKQVCSLLKAECGAGYTSKMEGMFQDIDLSRESMMVYKQSCDGNLPSNGVEMEVQILTTGYWPVYPQYPNLHLPDTLVQPREHFEAHYKKKCHGRRITWQYALGHTIVRTFGFNKAYELVVSLCQALVLIQFQTAETVCTLPQLMQAVGLDDRDEMERILQSLALGKEGTRILRKIDFDVDAPKKKIRMNVHDRDQFMIQQSFSSNQRRIRITNIMMKETKEERRKTVEAVSRDRLYLIDAVLVRILKARKTIMHQALIAQVLEQVKFPAQASDVKQRIESLIEREYMERDAKDRNRYNYLA